MFEPTGSQRDAASVIFNLPGYRVIDAVDLPLGGRRVKVEPTDLESGCPGCGVVSSRVHAWVEQRFRDVPYAGRVEVVVRKPRLVCAEPACRRRTFTHTTSRLPVRSRCTTRLRTAVLAAVVDSGARSPRWPASWGWRGGWCRPRSTPPVLLPDVDRMWVRRLGIDEHRYRLPGSATTRVTGAGGAVDVDDAVPPRERRQRSGPRHRGRPRLRRGGPLVRGSEPGVAGDSSVVFDHRPSSVKSAEA